MRAKAVFLTLVICSGIFGWVIQGVFPFWGTSYPAGRFATAEASTGLPLKLVGTVTPKQGEAVATIRDLQSGNADLYLAGEQLPHGVVLIRIAPGKVLLRRGDGKRFTLTLEPPQGAHESKRIRGLQVARFPDKTILLVETMPTERPDFSFSKKQVPADMSTGELKGYAIRGTAFEEVIAALELRDGDVILAVNEQSLDTFQTAARILDEALRELPLTLTVFRKRANQTFTYFLAGVAELAPAGQPAPPAADAAQPAGSPTGFTGCLLVIGMAAGHVPRTMDLQLRATDGTEPMVLQIRPHSDARGAFKGLEISQVRPIQEVERIGLKKGDVITAINGVRLTGLFQTLRTVRKAFKETSVDVELSRGEETFIRTLEQRLSS
ncbi:MAG: hypothetical protein NC819_01270 [Candidatus Omnitrophica bacterium]|nr:hypothetical protein [Candidatus Omnitrophota bacterium]